MGMDRIEKGMLARSKAGHDKDQIYVIYDIDETYVYLVNGNNRTLEKPKKKKRKHVQIICENHDVSEMDDVKIKRIIKIFDKEIRRI